jgi:predicted Zn-dependent protease
VLRHGISIINETKLENELSAIADWAAGTAASQSAQSARAATFRDSITTSIDTLMRSGYSQTQEFEADREAAVLLANAGYDPYALIDMLKVLQSARGSQRNGLYSTHPSPEQRIANFNIRKIDTTLQYRVQRFRGIKF